VRRAAAARKISAMGLPRELAALGAVVWGPRGPVEEDLEEVVVEEPVEPIGGLVTGCLAGGGKECVLDFWAEVVLLEPVGNRPLGELVVAEVVVWDAESEVEVTVLELDAVPDVVPEAEAEADVVEGAAAPPMSWNCSP
jgi:hypothetical protein